MRSKFSFKFHHRIEEGEVKLPSGKVKPTKATCVATIKAAGEEIASGVSFCSVQDRYNKETGRRKAIEDALKFFPRISRSEIWEAYWATKRFRPEY